MLTGLYAQDSSCAIDLPPCYTSPLSLSAELQLHIERHFFTHLYNRLHRPPFIDCIDLVIIKCCSKDCEIVNRTAYTVVTILITTNIQVSDVGWEWRSVEELAGWNAADSKVLSYFKAKPREKAEKDAGAYDLYLNTLQETKPQGAGGTQRVDLRTWH